MNTTRARASGNLLDASMIEPVIFIENGSFQNASSDDMLSLPVGSSIYADCVQNEMMQLDGVGDFEMLTDLPLLSPEGETFLFRKMNYMRFQAEQVRLLLLNSTGSRKLQNTLRSLLHDAESVRNHIAQCNLRLVISLARKFSNSSCDFDELMSEGNEILLKAITKFDFSRGFRFSTYATHSVQRHFYRFAQRQKRRNSVEFKSGVEFLNEVPATEEDPVISEWVREEHRVNELIMRMAECLDGREQMVIVGRFGLSENRVVKTLRELATDLGLSKERVRQLQIAAVDKLREFFEELEPGLVST